VRAEHAEVVATLHALNQCFEDLVVRGLKSAGPDDVKRLGAIAQEFGRSGAGYVADVLDALVRATREGDDGAPRYLLRAQTAARVFERVLSLDSAAEALGSPTPPAASGSAAAKPSPPSADRKALIPVLEEMADVVEGLVGSGLTTASESTRQKLDASGKEAARAKLGRLSASIRYVNDELGRFLSESQHFSARRLAFFLNRVWLISRGLKEAIDENNTDALARLLWQSAPTPVKSIRAVTLGVQKRALLDGSASFDFRMRVLDGGKDLPRGTRLVWSTVFAAKKGVPAEAFLHLPQAQKFMPKLLLEPTEVTITECAVTIDDFGNGRLMLGPKSTVTAGAKQKAWDEFFSWDPQRSLERVMRHQVTPLDLEVELQEEIVVTEYELGTPAPHPQRPELQVFPMTFGALELDATVSTGPDGEALLAALKGLKKKGAKKPPLFGLMHYDFCRLAFFPLSLQTDEGPEHLMISRERIDLASLMKTLDLRT
jgi:hypothetical protein